MDEQRERLVRKGNYIHGSFITPESIDGYINCVNPGDRSDVLGRFPFSARSVDDAVARAQEGAAEWAQVGLNDRAQAVKRFRDSLGKYTESIAHLITRETGKPLWESRHEVIGTIRALDIFLDDGLGLLAPRVLGKQGARTDYTPRGVVALLCPYNPPLRMAATQTAAALLGGNSVVFKASKFTPAVGQMVAECWDRCRLPRGVVNMVQGSGSVVGHRIVTHSGVDALLCTGSFKTAMSVRKTLFRRPELPVIYQTGGKGVAVVLDDADLDKAVYEVMLGAFLTTGQRHNSTARVIVEKGIYPRFIEELVRRSSRLTVGFGMHPGTFMGPLISENIRNRFHQYTRALEAKGHGALLERAPFRDPQRRGFYVTPAIHAVDHKNPSPFLNDEPPGPVLLVYKAEDVAEAAELHNRAVYRLVCSVFTEREGAELAHVLAQLKTGGVNVNRATLGFTMRLPSVGLGRASSFVSADLNLVRALTHPKAQLVESRPFDAGMAVPGTHWLHENLLDGLGKLSDEETSIHDVATVETLLLSNSPKKPK